MTSRERIKRTLEGGIPDRVGRHEAVWAETLRLWRSQGMPEDVSAGDYFGYDIEGLPWVDLSLRLPGKTIEETDQWKIWVDGNGVTRKDFKGEVGHTPHWICYTVQSRRDWNSHRERLVPSRERLQPNLKESYEVGRKKDRFVVYSGVDTYEAVWPLFGQVRLFTLMMDDPELVAEVHMTYAELIIGMMKIMLEDGIDFDGAFLCGDVGYRNGLLFGPGPYNELVFPANKKICDFLNALGKPVILHSCGKIKSLIPKFIEAGFAAIQPLEAKCDQDVRVLKPLYGDRITFFGNIDIRKLSGSKEEIEQEVVSKLAVAKEGGGYIFHSDHSVPPTVSLDNYTFALRLLDEHGKY